MPASLPMYDLPEIRQATDAWWQAIARALQATGLDQVPARLSRDAEPGRVWRDPDLILTQTCGYPLKFEFADTLRAVAVPVYRAPGCHGVHYRSALMVRESEAGQQLLDFADRRFAANSSDSQSGFNCIRAMLADASAPAPFFQTTVWTGGHRLSLKAVREHKADIAAIDAVTLELLRNHAGQELKGLKVIGFGPPAPGLPYATHIDVSETTFAQLRTALLTAADDTAVSAARDTLLIESIELIDTTDYEPVAMMHQRGLRYGCLSYENPI